MLAYLGRYAGRGDGQRRGLDIWYQWQHLLQALHNCLQTLLVELYFTDKAGKVIPGSKTSMMAMDVLASSKLALYVERDRTETGCLLCIAFGCFLSIFPWARREKFPRLVRNAQQ